MTTLNNPKADWPTISRTVSLDALYANSRTLKDSVYLKWIDNLQSFLLDPEKGKAEEAARRIDYIEQRLIGGFHA